MATTTNGSWQLLSLEADLTALHWLDITTAVARRAAAIGFDLQRRGKGCPPMTPSRPVTFEAVRRMALALPGVEEAPCYGTPGFRVRRKLLARFHQDGESLALKMDVASRDLLVRHRPRTFYVTDHYRDYPYVLVRLAEAEPDEVREHLEEAWRRAAPKRLVAEYDRRG